MGQNTGCISSWSQLATNNSQSLELLRWSLKLFRCRQTVSQTAEQAETLCLPPQWKPLPCPQDFLTHFFICTSLAQLSWGQREKPFHFCVVLMTSFGLNNIFRNFWPSCWCRVIFFFWSDLKCEIRFWRHIKLRSRSPLVVNFKILENTPQYTVFSTMGANNCLSISRIKT